MTEQEIITLVRNLLKQAGRDLDELPEFPGAGVVLGSTLTNVFNPVTRKLNKIAVSRLPGGVGGGSETESVFPEDEPPVATAVGNVPVGYELAGKSTLEVQRQQFSLPYQVPGFNDSLRIQGASDQTLEVGTPFAAGFKSVTWSTSNGSNVTPNSISFQDVTAGTTPNSNEANDGTMSASLAAFTVQLGESRRYRITGQNTQGGSFSDDVVISGLYASYFGYSTATSLSPAQVVALGNAQLQGGKGRTISGVTASGGAYLYYAYPASYGDLANIILDGAAPVLGAFQKLADVNATNSQGAPVTLRVYRSNAPDAFSNNTLAFS